MEFKDADGRIIVDVDVESNGDGTCFFSRAFYADDGTELDADALWALDEAYPEYLDERAFESAIMRAEDWADRDR